MVLRETTLYMNGVFNFIITFEKLDKLSPYLIQ